MDSSTILPNIVVGTVLLIVGIVVTIFRSRIFNDVVRLQRTIVGERSARTVARLSSPRWIAGVGVLAALMGAIALAFAVGRIATI